MSFTKFSVVLFLLGINSISGSKSFLRSEGQQSNYSIQRRTQSDNDASPQNAENSCPEFKPYMGDKCTELSTVCAYTSFACEGESEVHYIDKCYCSPTHVGDGLEYECFEMVIDCEESIPTTELEPESDSLQPGGEPEREIGLRNEPEAVCPESMPENGDTCSINTPTPCLYDVVLCEDTDEVYHRHRCFCENEKFDCLTNIILCSEKKEEEEEEIGSEDELEEEEEEGDGVTVQTFPPVAECPPSPPADMECSEESPNPCNYGPIQCVGSDVIHYSTTCICDGGKYLCQPPDFLIICEDGYVKACTEELKQCSDGSLVGRDSMNNCKFKDCPLEIDRKDQPNACPEDVYVCKDGNTVSRNSTIGCEFNPCSNQDSSVDGEDEGKVCKRDVSPCSDGTYVRRDPKKDCEFSPCPDTDSSKNPLHCTTDVKTCPDGTEVGRDSENKCEFRDCPDVVSGGEDIVMCTMDVKTCPDGTMVGRDAKNACEFEPCSEDSSSNQGDSDENPLFCPKDLRACPDGINMVGRDVENNCEFKPCPDRDSSSNPRICPQRDIKTCRNGESVNRDPNLNCEFPPCPGEIFSTTCPDKPPKSGEDRCSSDSLRCDYNPFSCPGETSTTFLQQCQCENSVFWCLMMDVWCAEECIQDRKRCWDGSIIYPDPNLNCEFPECPPQIADEGPCGHDAQECPDGSWVGRDPDNDCEFNPCPEPDTTDNCIECSDKGNKGMQRKGKTCSAFKDRQLQKKCKKKNWKKREFCQYSCFKAGYGYGDEICCETASE